MKRGLFIVFTLSLMIWTQAFGQTPADPVLMTVDGQEVTKTEFESIFRKNLKDTVITKEALDEYLELYIKFKLKVREAEMLGMDTVTKFRKELDGYRRQLSRPYLVDNEMNEELLREAYDRMKMEVRASHILIKLDPNATPEDTLRAYNRIMDLRKRIVGGEDFEAVAKGKGGSEDPSAQTNGGDLGYFTALQMVYPFENVAFSTPVGEVSMPVRTRFGYHILNIVDKREARGQIRVAHILVLSKDTDSPQDQQNAEATINELYGKVKNNADGFADFARQHSDDKASARKGGELPMFGTGRMVEEFADAAFALKTDGEISAPFKTRFGWHIVKRLEYKPLDSFESMEAKLKTRIARDSRSQKTKSSFLMKLKNEYGYAEFEKGWKALDKQLDTALFSAEWKPAKESKLAKKVLYQFNGKEYTALDVAKILMQRQTKQKTIGDPKVEARKIFNKYIDEMVLDFENGRLEEKYLDFRMLMKEYRDGILLFELTDKKVWRRAVEDTTGLNAFYEEHKNEFMWDERLDVTIYKCADAKVAKRVKYLIKKGKNNGEIYKEINAESKLNLKIESGKYEKGENNIADQFEWKEGTSDNKEIDGQVVFVVVNGVLQPMPKTLKEAKGLVTAKYQDYLEEAWIEELRKKYNVEVNFDVLYMIK